MYETPETGTVRHYDSLVRTQAMLVQSPRVINQALKDVSLQDLPIRQDPAAVATIRRNLSARAEQNTELILVSYRSESPANAEAVLNAVLRSYEKIHGSKALENQKSRKDKLQDHRAVLQDQVRTRRELLRDYIAQSPYRTADLQPIILGKLEQLKQLEAERNFVELSILRAGTDGASDADPSLDELAQFSPELAELLRTRTDLEAEFEQIKARYRNDHLLYLEHEKKIQANDLLIQHHSRKLIDEWRRTDGELAESNDPDATPLSTRDLHVKQLDDSINAMHAEIGTLSAQQMELQRLQADLTEAEDELEAVTEQLRAAQLESDSDKIAGLIEVTEWGDRPWFPSKDRRKPMAAMGLLGGFGCSVALFFLIGGIDQRTFSSRQLQRSSIQYRCLGVLPNLGSSQLEPRHSEMAAQCVHQIRNRIESVRDSNANFMLMVSSPYQGDGKTSLALALGWSYSLAGHRTLLIDCDFIGHGLTRETGVTDHEGLKDLLAQRTLGDQIVSLPAGNLDVLGIGLDPSIGPETLRKDDFASLSEELRRQYDVIIVDTGPFMGSIEILPVAAAADGVVLSVRRGRSRLPLETCIGDLQAIRVPMLGVVLNCADQSDCDRYVSESAAVSRRASAEEMDNGAHARNGASRRNMLVQAVAQLSETE
jgi:Mrp family chromosome partitioning ATPase/uncharacterized protein involved in exopolysaccharide biosynthesis